MRTFLAILLVLGVAAPADAGNNELTIGPFNRSLRTDSANAVTDQNLVGGTLGYGRRLELGLPRLETWATTGLLWGGTEGVLFQSMTTELDTLGFTAGGRARYALHRLASVSARVDLGTARTALKVAGGGHTVADAGWGATVGAGLGVELLAVSRPAFSLGVRFELGYVTMTAPSLAPRASRDGSTIQLDAMQASIGHLDLGGRYFSFAVLSQF